MAGMVALPGRCRVFGVLRELELVAIGILLARPTVDAGEIAELAGLEVDDAEELLAGLEKRGPSRVGDGSAFRGAGVASRIGLTVVNLRE